MGIYPSGNFTRKVPQKVCILGNSLRRRRTTFKGGAIDLLLVLGESCVLNRVRLPTDKIESVVPAPTQFIELNMVL